MGFVGTAVKSDCRNISLFIHFLAIKTPITNFGVIFHNLYQTFKRFFSSQKYFLFSLLFRNLDIGVVQCLIAFLITGISFGLFQECFKKTSIISALFTGWSNCLIKTSQTSLRSANSNFSFLHILEWIFLKMVVVF